MSLFFIYAILSLTMEIPSIRTSFTAPAPSATCSSRVSTLPSKEVTLAPTSVKVSLVSSRPLDTEDNSSSIAESLFLNSSPNCVRSEAIVDSDSLALSISESSLEDVLSIEVFKFSSALEALFISSVRETPKSSIPFERTDSDSIALDTSASTEALI